MARKDMPERQTYSVRLQETVLDSLKHLAVDEHRPLSALLEEAIRDILLKYHRTPPGGGQEESARGSKGKGQRKKKTAK